MASLGQIILVAGLAFLVLASQDQGHGGPAGGGGPAIGASAAITPQPPEVHIMSQVPPQPSSAAALAQSKQGPIPQSGPSDRWNYEVNHEKPSLSGGRRARTIVVRRLGGSA